MSHYYDYHPLVSLDRPLVLSGFLGAECRRIGYQLAALTGLTVTDLDRAIEHEAGQSVWKLILMEGENRYRELERENLQRQLRARPAGILTLGDGTLIDPENRRRVLAGSRWVLMDLDLANCFWRLTAESETPIQHWHPLYAGPLTSPDLLRPFYDLRRPGFDQAPERIDLSGKPGHRAVEELMAMLG